MIFNTPGNGTVDAEDQCGDSNKEGAEQDEGRTVERWSIYAPKEPSFLQDGQLLKSASKTHDTQRVPDQKADQQNHDGLVAHVLFLGGQQVVKFKYALARKSRTKSLILRKK